MVDTNEGGRASLAGYLFQILAAPALVVEAHARVKGAQADSDELDALLTLVGQGYVLHEAVGQDLAIIRPDPTAGEKCTLIQFKYSRAKLGSLSPSDLVLIASTLEKSRKQASKLGLAVSEYFLVTNRHLTKPAKKFLKEAQLGPPITYKGKLKGKTKQIPVAEAERFILQQLEVIKVGYLEHWLTPLRQFAATFGMDRDEVGEGISQLIGDLAQRTEQNGPSAVTIKDVVRALTGSQSTRPITFLDIAPIATVNLDDAGHELNVQPKLVRRPIMEVLSKAARTRAFIVLEGYGGSGKTATLWYHAKHLTRAACDTPGPVGTVTTALAVTDKWLTWQVCAWGNVRAHHAWRDYLPEDSLRRLEVANPGVSPPLLFLGVDGLDEGVEDREAAHHIEELLRWFSKEDINAFRQKREPLATLVVSCRSRSEVEIRWPQLKLRSLLSEHEYSESAEDRSPEAQDGEAATSPFNIVVDDFSLSELQDAAREFFGEEMGSRFYSAGERLAARSEIEEGNVQVRTLRATSDVVQPISSEVLDTLQHPIMWHALVDLPQESRLAVIGGESYGMRELAKGFIQWFCAKVYRRDKLRAPESTLEILKAVAYHTCSTGHVTHGKVSDWEKPSCATNEVGHRQAEFLYRQALSGGLIVADSSAGKQWRWRHPFVSDYLASLYEREDAVTA